jgi:two-component system, OmpR family, response regulator BaeR
MSKILIVDDSKELQEALHLFLTEKGYEVKCIENAINLLPVIKEFSPDIIFLDIYLQGEDGREVCKKLRSLSETKYLCIILFSASDKEVRRYKEYGADDYLEKPFGLNEVVQKIESTLNSCKKYSQYSL